MAESMYLLANRARLRVLLLAVARLASRRTVPRPVIRWVRGPDKKRPSWVVSFGDVFADPSFSSAHLPKLLQEVSFVLKMVKVARREFIASPTIKLRDYQWQAYREGMRMLDEGHYLKKVPAHCPVYGGPCTCTFGGC